MLDLTALLGTIADVTKLASHRLRESREHRIWKYLAALKPNELLTAQGLYLRFWGEALADVPLFPDQIRVTDRIRYRVKKRLMPFRDAEAIEKVLVGMLGRGVVEFDQVARAWRLKRPDDTPSRWRR